MPAAGALPIPHRPNQDKLAMASALFVTYGLAASNVLAHVRKDHLIKDGTALAFLIVYLRTFLSVDPSVEHLATSLRRGGITSLIEFMPANRRTFPELAAVFKKAGLESVTDLYQKQRGAGMSKEILSHLKEMIAGTDSNEEIIVYLKEQEKGASISEVDFVGIIWNGLVSGIDMNAKADQIGDSLLKDLKETAPILEAFCSNARTEVGLINIIQAWCYENTQVLNLFVKILLTLFNADVISGDAIIYWHSKGSKPEARQHFLKQVEPFVQKLKEQEEESEEE